MQKSKLSWFLKLMLALSLAFLYIPLVVLVIYSFNESKLVTVWGGFSTKWYGALLENDTILEAAWLSLRIAVVSSLAAVVLGTLAGYAMARIKRFRGSTLFAGMISAPMVMPDVITGLSMLLLIIQVQIFLQGSEWLQHLYFDRGFLPSSSDIRRCAWHTLPLSSVRGWSSLTSRSKKPQWTWARVR